MISGISTLDFFSPNRLKKKRFHERCNEIQILLQLVDLVGAYIAIQMLEIENLLVAPIPNQILFF